MLKIYNSLTKCKQTFVPLIANKVKLYVCGMTVYDYCHLGHARVMVVFDMVVRWFKATGYEVIYVRNITDVDDKIIQRAQENNESIESLTERFICAMNEDSTALGVLQPTFEPRATQYIENMVSMIQVLIDKGFAYIGSNGDVYYAVDKFPDYGKLSGKVPDDLYAGERVSINSYKKNPLDFVLWKTAKSNEPYWEAPWGKGRPGWHIECSAMCRNYLDKHFDIHGGGQDLQFPHHENEIAQSEAAHDTTFVNYWMHNGFVRVDNEKMSKSLGNFFTVREILKSYQAEDIKFFIYSSHYRSPLNYSNENLDVAKAALARLYTALRGLPAPSGSSDVSAYELRFHTAMNDDFNTPDAVSVLFDLAREVNRQRKTDASTAAELASGLKRLGNIIGLLESDPEDYLRGSAAPEGALADAEIDALVSARDQARADKNWAEADRLRDEVANANIILEDSASGTTWRRG